VKSLRGVAWDWPGGWWADRPCTGCGRGWLMMRGVCGFLLAGAHSRRRGPGAEVIAPGQASQNLLPAQIPNDHLR